jgi:hypothetical protein
MHALMHHEGEGVTVDEAIFVSVVALTRLPAVEASSGLASPCDTQLDSG